MKNTIQLKCFSCDATMSFEKFRKEIIERYNELHQGTLLSKRPEIPGPKPAPAAGRHTKGAVTNGTFTRSPVAKAAAESLKNVQAMLRKRARISSPVKNETVEDPAIEDDLISVEILSIFGDFLGENEAEELPSSSEEVTFAKSSAPTIEMIDDENQNERPNP